MIDEMTLGEIIDVLVDELLIELEEAGLNINRIIVPIMVAG